VDAVLHRIEALPGQGRYAVTFVRPDGGEQTATMQVGDGGVEVAEASLPNGWTRGTDAYRASADAVLAFAAARAHAAAVPTLRDVAGGWDVSLGNVVLGPAGTPVCTAHGEMPQAGDAFTCPECGAQSLLG
jgi:hypothetical protein